MSRPRLDITDQIYGRLQAIVTDWYKTKETGLTHWFCQCEDNNIVSVNIAHLKNGNTKSCGCLRKEKTSERSKKRKLDITDEIYGRLQAIVTDWYKTNLTGQTYWFCQCECGDIISVQLGNLKNGNTKSCGCLRDEKTSKRGSGKNNYFWKDGITPKHMQIRNSKEYKEFIQLILKKAKYTCQVSKEIGCLLNVHHIKGFNKILEENNITTKKQALECEELWNENNVVVLSEKWHLGIKTDNPNAFHRVYGWKDFTEEDFYTWFNEFSLIEKILDN